MVSFRPELTNSIPCKIETDCVISICGEGCPYTWTWVCRGISPGTPRIGWNFLLSKDTRIVNTPGGIIWGIDNPWVVIQDFKSQGFHNGCGAEEEKSPSCMWVRHEGKNTARWEALRILYLEHVAATDQEMGRETKMQQWFAVGSNRRQSWTTSNLAKTKAKWYSPWNTKEAATTTGNGEPGSESINLWLKKSRKTHLGTSNYCHGSLWMCAKFA